MPLPSLPKERQPHIDPFGGSLLIGFSALLGLNQALVKIVNDGFAPMFQAGLRSFFAFIVVLLWARYTQIRFNYRDGSIGWGTIAGLLFASEFGLLFLALDYTTVSRVSLFFYTMPLFTAVGAHFLYEGEQFTLQKIVGLLVALTGVGVALLDSEAIGTAERPPITWIGDLLALSGAVCWAGIALVTRSKLMGSSSEQVLLYQLAISAVLLILLAPLVGDTVREITPLIIGIFSFQVVAIASFGFLMWLWVLRIYPVSNMSSFSLLSPIFGVFFGWLIFDDVLTWRFVLALSLVGAGLVLINRR